MWTLPKVLAFVLVCQLVLPAVGVVILIGAARLLEMLFWAS